MRIRHEYATHNLIYSFISRKQWGWLIRSIDLFSSMASGAEENLDYGNRYILNEYAGVPINLPIFGRLQHGWVIRNKSGTYYKNNYIDTYVWSTKTLNWARQQRWENFRAIGAPWLYLLENLASDGWNPEVWRSKSVFSINELWVQGLHQVSTESGFGGNTSAFLDLANNSVAIRKVVLLAYTDHDKLPVDIQLKYPNLEIITLGHRRGSSLSNAHLVRIFDLLINSQKVILDFPTSFALYAMSIGCDIEWIENDSYRQGVLFSEETNNLELIEILKGISRDRESLRAFSLKALGFENLLTRDEMIELFHWENSFRSRLLRSVHLIWALSKLPIRIFQTFRAKSRGEFSL